MEHAHYQEIATAMLTGAELHVLLVHLDFCIIYCYYCCCSDLIPCQTSSPCRNGATCNNSGAGGYYCSCAPGYYGTDCQNETDECLLNRCQNGATCVVSSSRSKSINNHPHRLYNKPQAYLFHILFFLFHICFIFVLFVLFCFFFLNYEKMQIIFTLKLFCLFIPFVDRIRSMVTHASVLQDGLVLIVILTLLTAILTLVSMDNVM